MNSIYLTVRQRQFYAFVGLRYFKCFVVKYDTQVIVTAKDGAILGTFKKTEVCKQPALYDVITRKGGKM